MTTATADASGGVAARIKALQRNPWLGLSLALLGLVISAIVLWIVISTVTSSPDVDFSVKDILEPSKIRSQISEHLVLTFWSTLLVLIVAIPLGVFLTRERFVRYEGPVLGVASSGQAIPAYGLLVIFFTWFGRGVVTSILALTVFSLLPVLRNTVVGIQQVDPAIIEAGRGMGMRRRQELIKIELPLAVPVIMAGVRTALVINVGTAALAVFIGGGGLGETINSGLKLQRPFATFSGAAILAVLALFIDWLAAVIYRVVRPRGL